MIVKTCKGQVSSGEAIGILLLDSSVPFIPGDVANATTYSFPVRFQKVEGYTGARAIGKDPSVFGVLKTAAEDLASQGVRAITGDCGFMAIHQSKLTQALNIPVFLSSLLQIVFIQSIIGDKAKVGVITANSTSLDSELLFKMGVRDPDHVVIEGLEHRKHFFDFALAETGDLDIEAVEKEVVNAAQNIVQKDSSVRAILLECSLLPPYAAAVQEAVNLPVFDFITMINYVFSAVVRQRFDGFM